MKLKILCLILIISVVCSFFVISASANDEYVIEAGTYKWDDELPPFVPDSDYTNDFPILLSTPVVTINVEGTDFVLGGDFLGFHFGGLYYDELSYIETYNPPSSVTGTVFYTPSDGWNVAYNLLKELGTDDPSLKGLGQTFTIAEDTVVDDTIYTYFVSHTSSVSNTGVLSAGSYESSGDALDISSFGWISSGETVYFNANGYVIQGFNTGTRFDQIAIIYIETSPTAYTIGIQALRNGENLGAICTLSHSNEGSVFRWDTVNFPDAYGIHFDNDVVLPTDILNIFLVMFEPFEQVYTGNVWYDIIDNVVEALKVDVFGYFSPWDILTTFIGLAVFLWLLKALAGG